MKKSRITLLPMEHGCRPKLWSGRAGATKKAYAYNQESTAQISNMITVNDVN